MATPTCTVACRSSIALRGLTARSSSVSRSRRDIGIAAVTRRNATPAQLAVARRGILGAAVCSLALARGGSPVMGANASSRSMFEQVLISPMRIITQTSETMATYHGCSLLEAVVGKPYHALLNKDGTMTPFSSVLTGHASCGRIKAALSADGNGTMQLQELFH